MTHLKIAMKENTCTGNKCTSKVVGAGTIKSNNVDMGLDMKSNI